MQADAQLIDRARDGDEQAFADLVGPHVGGMLRRLRGIVGDGGEAEDVLQETLLSAWIKLPTFAGEGSFGGWLHAIARNNGLNALRSRAVRSRVRFLDAPPEAPDVRSPESHTIAGEKLDRVERVVRGLSAEQREVFTLRLSTELTFREIAARQGVPLNTALGRMHAARRRLSELG